MSFYGNSYQYLAETFAYIVMKNAGIENIAFPELTNDEKKSIEIRATNVDSGLGIGSGNRWITLKPTYGEDDKTVPHGFEIWHSSPSVDGELTKIVTESFEEVPSVIEATATQLGFDNYIKIPIITYDQAGHSMATDEAMYYKLPADPSGPFYDRLWKVDGINPEGVEEEPEGGSLKRKLLDRMTSIDGCDDTGTPIENEQKSLKYQLTTQMSKLDEKLTGQMSELDEKVEKWDDLATAAATDAESAAKDAQAAKDAVAPIAERMSTIEQSFDTLKNKDFKELKDYINDDVTKQINSLNTVVMDLSSRILELENK